LDPPCRHSLSVAQFYALQVPDGRFSQREAMHAVQCGLAALSALATGSRRSTVDDAQRVHSTLAPMPPSLAFLSRSGSGAATASKNPAGLRKQR